MHLLLIVLAGVLAVFTTVAYLCGLVSAEFIVKRMLLSTETLLISVLVGLASKRFDY